MLWLRHRFLGEVHQDRAPITARWNFFFGQIPTAFLVPAVGLFLPHGSVAAPFVGTYFNACATPDVGSLGACDIQVEQPSAAQRRGRPSVQIATYVHSSASSLGPLSHPHMRCARTHSAWLCTCAKKVIWSSLMAPYKSATCEDCSAAGVLYCPPPRQGGQHWLGCLVQLPGRRISGVRCRDVWLSRTRLLPLVCMVPAIPAGCQEG